MDSDYETSIASDADSFASLEEDIQTMSMHISEMYGLTEELEEYLTTLRRPMTHLELSQLGDTPFLKSSPFRNATFSFQKDIVIPGFDHGGKRYSFQTICSMIRDYLFRTHAVQMDGQIKLSRELQKVFGCNDEYVSYPELILKLKNVLV
jgi:hypothetical protein